MKSMSNMKKSFEIEIDKLTKQDLRIFLKAYYGSMSTSEQKEFEIRYYRLLSYICLSQVKFLNPSNTSGKKRLELQFKKYQTLALRKENE